MNTNIIVCKRHKSNHQWRRKLFLLMSTVSLATLASSGAMAASVCISQANFDNINQSGIFSDVSTNESPNTFRLDNATVLDSLDIYIFDAAGDEVAPVDVINVTSLNPNLTTGQSLAIREVIITPGGMTTVAGASVGAGSSLTSSSGGAGGPAALTAIEVSNDQASEFIRQRRELAMADILDEPEQVDQQEPQTGSASPAPKKKKAAKKVQKTKAKKAAQVKQTASGQKPKKTSASAMSQPQKPELDVISYEEALEAAPEMEDAKYGTWAQVYADFEEHENLSPGSADNPTRKKKSFGFLGGFDYIFAAPGQPQKFLQLGFFAGHNKTKSTFSDTTNVTGASQKDEGGFLGGYANYHDGPFTLELMTKLDLFQHTKRQTVSTSTIPSCNSGEVLLVDDSADLDAVVAQVAQSGKVSENNYTIGGNIYYRIELGGNSWIEPLAGATYTYTDFGSGAAALNLQDGEVLRLQGGLRTGTSQPLGNLTFTASLTGIIYSDVYIDGFALPQAGAVSTASNVDEGKIRALGQLNLGLANTQGLSVGLQMDVRGGEDVYGYGGRALVRYKF